MRITTVQQDQLRGLWATANSALAAYADAFTEHQGVRQRLEAGVSDITEPVVMMTLDEVGKEEATALVAFTNAFEQLEETYRRFFDKRGAAALRNYFAALRAARYPSMQGVGGELPKHLLELSDKRALLVAQVELDSYAGAQVRTVGR